MSVGRKIQIHFGSVTASIGPEQIIETHPGPFGSFDTGRQSIDSTNPAFVLGSGRSGPELVRNRVLGQVGTANCSTPITEIIWGQRIDAFQWRSSVIH
jgi:hypothetical protein